MEQSPVHYMDQYGDWGDSGSGSGSESESSEQTNGHVAHHVPAPPRETEGSAAALYGDGGFSADASPIDMLRARKAATMSAPAPMQGPDEVGSAALPVSHPEEGSGSGSKGRCNANKVKLIN